MQTTKLIPTKLIAGKSAPMHKIEQSVERSELLARLSVAKSYPLTLVTAPAGYGKTTLVSQWKTQLLKQNQSVVWFALDESDNKAEQFSHYFAAALASITDISLQGINYQNNLIDYFGQLLVQLAEVSQPFYVILDDYHLIENSEIHDALRFWLKHQPDTMSLILISRLTPPLSITNLRIREKVLEIDVHQLAFSPTEARQFFELKLNTALTDSEIFTLCERVEGWATALQLMVFALKQNAELVHFPEKLLYKLNQQHIADYLNEEVFYYVDPTMKRFMQRCAILRSMNEKLIVALTQDENGIKTLDELEKLGLFLTRINNDNGEVWWKFHPILASYLAQSCRVELPNEWQSLHRTAALMWLKLGYSSEALYHAQILDDPDTLYQILQQHGWALFHQGQLKLLEDCLNRLPTEQLWQDENLVLLKAWLAQSQHRHQEVSGILQKCQPKAPLTASLQGRFDALRAQVEINAGNEEQAYLIASQALSNLSSEFGYAQIVATSVIGEAQHCRGYLKEALALMQQVEKMATGRRAYHHWLWSKLQQSEILSAQGFWQSAYDLLKETTQQTTEFHQIPMNEFLLRLKGQILWEWHHLDQAEAMANAGIEVLENEEEHIQCLTLLAKISLTKGDLNNAERLIEQCCQLLSRCSPHKDWVTAVDEVQLIYWQMCNQTEQSESWLAQANFPAQEHNHFTQRQWRNIARCYLLQQDYDQALKILNSLLRTSGVFNLVSDSQRALILRNRVYTLQNRPDLAQRDLIQALNLSRQTNFISAFVIEGDLIAQQIRQLLQLNVLEELTVHKAQFILRSINQHNRHKTAHFDEEFVANLLKNPHIPEMLKISPLTQREWQVLGLIYSGYSNEQICQELFVAMTTIKTHIRNIYQKIGVSNRAEAIEYTRSLLRMMGYH
ncbi:HTH-type transcriptional regulator MalT [Muribacter muris]|uniref:HTH-type transcriptional regulator MalT n=1 Tax=Muribacter muris TaxID=67855 RepID=A0A4Y9JZE9_9PAST|nr:HTH-type transcriptional regulator MalT [Muribacter muris]MBF0784727.1 HTH-type transcriptional regulator MalT [Muribacter muris]MBF0827826.1 HTH-type transcriptional regulator MalT [Muribacter muris]TFV11153.1 HTH-type transcriptional regulator MalT [Muribacter muris]